MYLGISGVISIFSTSNFSGLTSKCVITTYIINMQLYTGCILRVYIFVIHPDDGHRSDRNILIKNNNMRLKIFIKYALAYHISIK